MTYRAATDLGLPIRVPAAVVAEFWRGQHSDDIRELLRERCVPDSRERAQRAGEALAAVQRNRSTPRGPSVVDAMVAAVASEHGDRVVTSDPDDLSELAAWFGGLTLLRV